MDDGEVLHTSFDRNSQAMPREGLSRKSGAAPKRPALWQKHVVRDAGPDIYGRLPVGFLSWAYEVLSLRGSANILHVCSGGLGDDTRGVRVDIRASVRPDVVADGCALPFPDDTFDGVVIDPPYSVEYAEVLYGTGYPRPSALLREAARVVRSSRRIGILHFLVPMPVDGLAFVEVHGVTTGCGYRIRAFTVFEKAQRGLFVHG